MPVKQLTTKPDFEIAVGSLRHFMSFVAIWPKMRQTLTVNIIWFVFLVGFSAIISGSYAGVAMSYGNFERVLEMLGETIPISLIIIKYAFFKKQIQPLRYFLKIMEDDWKRQKEDSPKGKDANRYREIMVTHARGARIFFNVYTSVVMTCWALYIIEPATKTSSSSPSTNIPRFPLNSWYPLPSNPSPFYEIIYTVEVVLGTAMVIANTSIDSLLVAAVLHLCGQLEILRCYIEGFHTRGRGIEMMHDDVKFIVNRHNSLIEAAYALESSFNLLLLGQLLVGTVHICVSGFTFLLAMESNDPTMLLKFGLLVTMALQEMFIYSFAGDYLTSQASGIRTAAYKAKWYELPPSLAKSFSIIMMRTTKPVTITAGKFYPMSLNSFNKLLRSAASYLSVLRAMNTDKLN